MAGPLPSPSRRRRNPPTIPTTNLPASGRPGRAPAMPPGVKLGKAGRVWWLWAWKTPQAAAWASGHEGAVARRASLEDDLAVISLPAAVERLMDALDDGASETTLRNLLTALARTSTGKLAIVREMRELDDRLGLTPKAMAALRWTVVPDDAGKPAAAKAAKDELGAAREARRARLAAGSA